MRLLGDINWIEGPTPLKKQILPKKYFIDLVALITFHVRNEFREERSEMLRQRRAHYESGNDQAYEDVVREIYLKQETLFN